MKNTCDLETIHGSSTLSKQRSWLKLVVSILGVFLIALFFDNIKVTGKTAVAADKPLSRGAGAAALDCGDAEFAQYGVTVTGFTREQENLILQTLSSYAKALGGTEQLNKLFTIYNGFPCQEIFFDPEGVGAYTDIRLTPTVFNVQKALAANYSHYYVATEAEHAQVVIGHEIGHLLGYAALQGSGVDWFQRYRERVQRDWQNTSSQWAFEEEAVTQLSLAVLGKGYYYRLQGDKIETDLQRNAEIQAWVADFLHFLREL